MAALKNCGMMRAFQAPISQPGVMGRRLFATEMQKQGSTAASPGPNTPPQDIPDPPGMFATLAAMGAGATGAVFIAAVGVWGVFKMAFWVAKESGRSLNPGNNNDTTPPPQNSAQTIETEEGSSRKIASAESPRIPTPLEQQLRLQQEIRRRVLGGEWRVNAPSYHHSMAVE